jgi:beta-glucosidase
MKKTEKIVFSDSFIWGAASAAYQIEGSPLADGAAPSNWHEFSHRRRTIKDGSNGDVACDHYNRYTEDIGHIRELGLKAYRFSIGWGRIFPEPGRLNQKGIDFYERLVDGLIEAGVDPWVSIFHLEEPDWLSREGGFVERGAVDHLVELGAILFQRLGDRVQNWITVNEPTVYGYLGHATGEFPPGRRFDLRGSLACAHHLVLAHARLCKLFAGSGRRGMIGLAHHAVWVAPARPDRHRDRETAALMDDAANGCVLDPLFRGEYPERVLTRLGTLLPRSVERDLVEMKNPGTYVGINYYSRTSYRWSPLMPFVHASEYVVPGSPRSAMWEIYPSGLFMTLLRLKEKYGNPSCIVTENGFPLPDAPDRDPLVDEERIAYLSDHIAMVGKAIDQGVRCLGYFHWSLTDNFEWNWGLRMRFGLLHIDFVTQKRKWKKSAFWYRDLIRSNQLEAAPPAADTAAMP